MQRKGIQAFYINGSDPHLSEYLPDRWQTRAFISGFTGSYGWLAITANDAALWTDSRYFLQAGEQLKGTGIRMMKARLPETPDVTTWLISKLPEHSKVGINPECVSFSLYKKMKQVFSQHQVEITETGDLLNEIWENRPPFPSGEIYGFEQKYTGESRKSKIARIRKELQMKGAGMQIITALDDIAWTFNLRGNDIEYNPVFSSYAIIGQENAILFANTESISATLKTELENDGISLHEYASVFSSLKGMKAFYPVYIDPDRTNCRIISSLPSSCKIVEGISIPCYLKAQKNEVEIGNIRKAMISDGIALTEFWYWFEDNINKGKIITEYDVTVQLSNFRKKQKNYKGDSFFPVSAYNRNGAIVHFHVEKEDALAITGNGLLLLDSGAHYLIGTTDITRTILAGEPTDRQKNDFTLVLKGLIALSETVFPEGTCGCHLDILARKALWKHGLNYGHGTGHGVGFFLNVHEGPMEIRQGFNSQPMQTGQVLSNEPGIYRENEYGIRIENIMVCVEKENTGFGKFLGFETLTLFPIDTRMIETRLLSEEEIQWINSYHQQVYDRLAPLLPVSLKAFLREKTKAI